MKNLTIIYPNVSNRAIIKKITEILDENDELITFKSNSSTLKDDLNKYIKNAVFDDVLIISIKDTTIFDAIEKFRRDGLIYNNPQNNNKKVVSSKTSIKINRNETSLPQTKVNNVKKYIQELYDNSEMKQEISTKEKEARKQIISKKKLSNSIRDSNKPKILFISDVKGWAWWLKSEFIKYYLSDEFDIDIISVVDDKKSKIDSSKYDLYLTFGWSYVHFLVKSGVPYHRRITGVTAHRPFNTLKKELNKTKYIHANSLMLSNEVKSINPNVFYVPNGVDASLFYPIQNKEENFLSRDYINIGHVGKKAKLKCQDTIIEPCVKKLSKYGFKYISHYNDYRNRIPHTEMPKLYNNMDIFIVASKEDGTPNGALEAMASGIPVISNKIGNMPEIIINGYNGYLVDKLDIDSYIDLIKNLDKEHIIEMGKNARQSILNSWTWEKKSENYRNMFHKILGE